MVKKSIYLTFLLFLFLGCSHNKAPKEFSTHTSLIVSSASNIDGIVKDSVFSTPVKVETDNIRGESKKLDKLSGERESLIRKLQKEITYLKNQVMADQVRLLNKVSLGLILLAALLLYFKQIEFAGLSTFVSLCLFGAAQIISSWWFIYAISGVILGGVIYFAYIFYKKQIEEETGLIVFSKLEDFYNKQDKETKEWLDDNLFVNLSKKMDEKHKKVIRGVKLIPDKAEKSKG